MMVEEIGISHSSVQRIWNAHGLKPHLVRTFQGLQRARRSQAVLVSRASTEGDRGSRRDQCAPAD